MATRSTSSASPSFFVDPRATTSETLATAGGSAVNVVAGVVGVSAFVSRRSV